MHVSTPTHSQDKRGLRLGAIGIVAGALMVAAPALANSGDTTVSSPAKSNPVVQPDPGHGDGAERLRPTHNVRNPIYSNFDPNEARATRNGVRVFLWGGVSPCFALDSYTVVENRKQVTIALRTGALKTREPVACIEIAKRYYVDIKLRAPLGDRTVIDAAPVSIDE